MARFPIRPQSPNPRIKIDEDNTPAVYGDLQYLYDYVMQNGGGGGGGQPGPPGPPGPEGAPGPVGMTWKGGWSNTVNYVVRDVVIYNGSGYICTANIAASNNNPTVAVASWDLLVSKGSQGIQGVQGIQGAAGPVGPTGLNWQGTWNPSTSYVADDAVGYNGASYFCIQNITGNIANQNPFLDTTHWALLAAQGAPGPQGVQGPQGAQGIQGDPGPQGPAGPPNTLTIGTVVNGGTASATITGTAPNQTLNLVLPQGPQGPPGSGTGSILVGHAVYVSKTGDNTTGAINNISLPYETVEAAMNVALPGYTIIVFPGDYEMTDGLTLKDTVNFQFLGKGKLTLVSTIKKPLFSDTSSATAVNCTILAPGWTFEGIGNTRTDTLLPPNERGFTKGVLKLSKASNVKLVADRLLSDDCVLHLNGSLGTATLPSYVGAIVPILDVKANEIRKKSGVIGENCCIGGQYAQVTANVTDIIADASQNQDSGPIFYKYFEKAVINATNIINKSPLGLAVYVDDSAENDRGYFNVDFIKSGDGWTFWTHGGGTTGNGGTFYANIKRIESDSDCCVVNGYANLTIEGTTVVSTGAAFGYTDGIFHCENGGLLTIINCIVERTDENIQGNDIYASLGEGKVKLINTIYNPERALTFPPRIRGSVSQCYIKSWNGTNFVDVPYVDKATQDNLFTDFTGSNIQGGYIFLKQFTNCAIRNSTIIDSSIYFTANSEVIENVVIQNDVLISEPPTQTLPYGSTINLIKPVNLLVGLSGSGVTTINLPTCAEFTFTYSSFDVITVSAVTSGLIALGSELIAPSVPPGTIIVDQITPTTFKVSKISSVWPYPSSTGRTSYPVGNKFIVSDMGAGASSITVNAGSNARIYATAVGSTYTLAAGESATFKIVDNTSGVFKWKLEK